MNLLCYPLTGGHGRWHHPMACVDMGPVWTAAGDGLVAPGVTASVSATVPAAGAARRVGSKTGANKVAGFQARGRRERS